MIMSASYSVIIWPDYQNSAYSQNYPHDKRRWCMDRGGYVRVILGCFFFDVSLRFGASLSRNYQSYHRLIDDHLILLV